LPQRRWCPDRCGRGRGVSGQLQADHETTLAQFRRELERARYGAQRAERRYRAVDPDNRLVARGLEAEWESALRELKAAEAELANREHSRPRPLSGEQRDSILSLGKDLKSVWAAPSTSDRDRKELLRTLLEEVTLCVEREKSNAHLTLRWRGGLFSELDVPLPRSHPAPIRTAEDTIDLLRRLATHYCDAVIAGILNRQGRKTATGLSFTANRVSSLRTHWNIPCSEPSQQTNDAQCVTVERAAQALGVAPSTLHRWLNDGFIAGEQVTPGAPWRIRLDDELRARFVQNAPDGYVTMLEATRLLGVSRQTILQRVSAASFRPCTSDVDDERACESRYLELIPISSTRNPQQEVSVKKDPRTSRCPGPPPRCSLRADTVALEPAPGGRSGQVGIRSSDRRSSRPSQIAAPATTPVG